MKIFSGKQYVMQIIVLFFTGFLAAANVCAATYSISGKVKTSGGAAISGVAMKLGGAKTATVTTGTAGTYVFKGLYNGSYTVTPGKAGYAWTPSSLNVTVSGANITRNFIGVPTYSISGKVKTSGGAAISGVAMKLGGAKTATVTTGTAGTYVFKDLYNGSYTVTPGKTGYACTPTSLNVNVNGSNMVNQNFVGRILPAISSLSTNSAAPTTLLTITGSGFDGPAALSVRFFNSAGFKLDIPVLVTASTSVVVSVPPYIDPATGSVGTGTVNIRVIKNAEGSVLTSNTIHNFQIQDLPTSVAPAGAVTLDLLNGIIDYDVQLQNDIKGSLLDIPELDSAVADNISSLQNLFTKIKAVSETPSKTFTLGSINGNNVVIGTEALKETDRMIIGMFETLSSTGVAAPVIMVSPLAVPNISQQTAVPCQQEANNYVDNLVNCSAPGQCSGNGNTYDGYAGCASGGLPVAAKTANEVVGGAGTGAMAVLGLGGAPAAALALPGAALFNANVMSIVTQIDVAAALRNSDNASSYKAIHQAVDQIEEQLKDLLVGRIIPETAGTLKDIYSGAASFIHAFENTKTLTPPPSCAYIYSDWSACQGGSQTRTVISSSPAGCVGTPVLSQSCSSPCCGCYFDVYCTVYGPGGCWYCHNSSYSGDVCPMPSNYPSSTLISPGACSCDPGLYAVCE